jgi:hypothetical protein
MLVAQGSSSRQRVPGRENMRTHEAYARLRAGAAAFEGRGARRSRNSGALAFYRSVGASRYVRRSEAVLPASA